MLKVHENYPLRNNTSYGVDIASSWFAEPTNSEELKFIISHAKSQNWDYYIIGEGSNLLFQQNYKGLIIHPTLKGIDIIDESESELLLKVGAGENWDKLVAYCVENSWYGPENLSLIPGSVGAAPVQNIGAYGKEAKDIIEFVEVFDVEKMTDGLLSNNECEFGYRDSIFKHGARNKYIVTHVIFRLQKNGDLNLEYGNVKEEFSKSTKQNLQGLRDTIISIRSNKLPDPKEYGNAGSFFKNPLISIEHFQILSSKFDAIPNYPAQKGKVKIPAAWLIEKAGWKGVRKGDAGTWPSQALVLVNYGNATGKELFDFSENIRQGVNEKFNIDLEREVTIV